MWLSFKTYGLMIISLFSVFMYIGFCTFTLVPVVGFLSLIHLPSVYVSVECWICKWYFASSLLACRSGCLFIVWIIIVVTIYSDYLFLVKLCFTALILYCLIVLFLLHMHFKIFAYNDHLVLLFSGKTYSYGSRVSQFLELGVSEFW